jgi:hypothetical protein
MNNITRVSFLALFLLAALRAASSPAATESDARAAVAENSTFARLTSPDARERFLAIEQFARLPEAEQSIRLPDFYTQLPTRSLSMFVEGILSSYPHDILDRRPKGDAYDGNTARWAQQLADAAPVMTAEQVADKMEGRTWLDVAARARALWVFKQHPGITSNLIAADLELRDTNAVQRAAATILALKLRTFTPRLLGLWMANDELSQPVWMTLISLRDPAMVKPLLERVEQDPKFLIRCAGLFQGTLYGQPADPVLLKLLDSPDPEIRYHAAYALEECTDARLARPAVRLVGETNSESRFVAAHMVARLPEASFQEVRAGLLPLLGDPDEHVRSYALLNFGQRKDLAAGPVILEALRRDQFAEQNKVWVMQAMGGLSGNTWNYDSHEWGPASVRNEKAIGQFEAWLKKRQSATKAGE